MIPMARYARGEVCVLKHTFILSVLVWDVMIELACCQCLRLQ
jgi:hypothetical protein